MAIKKKPPEGVPSKAKTYDAQNRYHRNRQPQVLERWSSTQFQNWTVAMGYVGEDSACDVALVAAALKCHTTKVYAYLRGNDGKRDVTVPPGVVALCKALLKIQLLEKQIADLLKEPP